MRDPVPLRTVNRKRELRAIAVSVVVVLVTTACDQRADIPPFDARPVPASAETEAMIGGADPADDPALWVHPERAERSLILGTNKYEGLYVYDLDGRERQRLLVGRVNNVDVRNSLAVASNDEVGGLSWFRVVSEERESVVKHIGDTPVERYEPYGICLGIFDGVFLVGVTYKDGALELWQAMDDGEGLPQVALLRQETLPSQLEGCVFDDAHRRLFVGEEAHGVWSLDLSKQDSRLVEVDAIAARNGLAPDVEGLSLFTEADGSGYLMVSAQGADRFVVYDRLPPHTARGAITVTASRDKSQEDKPGMREAWPMDCGRTRASFSRASSSRPSWSILAMAAMADPLVGAAMPFFPRDLASVRL